MEIVNVRSLDQGITPIGELLTKKKDIFSTVLSFLTPEKAIETSVVSKKFCDLFAANNSNHLRGIISHKSVVKKDSVTIQDNNNKFLHFFRHAKPVFIYPKEFDGDDTYDSKINIIKNALLENPPILGVAPILVGPEDFLDGNYDERAKDGTQDGKRLPTEEEVQKGLIEPILELSRKRPDAVIAPGTFTFSESIATYIPVLQEKMVSSLEVDGTVFKVSDLENKSSLNVARTLSPVFNNGKIVSMPPKGGEFIERKVSRKNQKDMIKWRLDWYGEDSLDLSKYVFWGGEDVPKFSAFSQYPTNIKNRVFDISERKIGLSVCRDFAVFDRSLKPQLDKSETLDLYIIQAAGISFDMLNNPSSFIKENGAAIYCNLLSSATFENGNQYGVLVVGKNTNLTKTPDEDEKKYPQGGIVSADSIDLDS